MKRTLAAIVLITIAAFLAAQAPRPAPSPDARFITCDVLIDSGQTPLAAWQIDVRASIAGGTIELVGVEGSGAAAKTPFAEPPFYDPEALTRDRVVLAAFSTEKPESLPTGEKRIARLHMRITGEAAAAANPAPRPEFTSKLITAADPTGAKITPTVRATLGDTP